VNGLFDDPDDDRFDRLLLDHTSILPRDSA
jgi:hypothetical protein